MAPYAATKKNAQNSYSCTNDGSRGRRDESHRDACACIAGWRRVPYESKRSWPGAARGGSGPAVWCVLGGVLLSRTLAGAVPSALSGLASGFGMDTGRFPVAVTTETTTWAVRQCSCDSVIGPPCNAHCVWLVVGLGVDRIVDARVYRIAHPPGVPTHARRVCVGGCCCLCWPISTSQLTDRCRSSTSGLSTQ